MLSRVGHTVYPRLITHRQPLRAPSAGITWPRSAWEIEPYRAALRSLSVLHADWWGHADIPGPWAPLDLIYTPQDAIQEAQSALDKIQRFSRGSKFLSETQIGTLRVLLDDPSPLLSLLQSMPRTLITNTEPGSIESSYCGQDNATVGIGPAAYDLACFYSSSRWGFGRTPLSMASTRAAYLQHLSNLLPTPVARCEFDEAFDAAMAWRFAILWTQAMADRPLCLLARAHQLQAAVVEPAFASLRRVMRS